MSKNKLKTNWQKRYGS